MAESSYKRNISTHCKKVTFRATRFVAIFVGQIWPQWRGYATRIVGSMSERHLLFTTSSQAIGGIRCDLRDGTFDFHYYLPWQLSKSSFSLSPCLPITNGGITSRAVGNYLVNLLPEGQARWAVSTRNKLSSSNISALAHLCGHEPAGAASILWHDHKTQLPGSEEALAVYLPDDDLAVRINCRDSMPFSFWHGRFYQSLAGVQDKMQVVLKEDRLYLVDGSLNSTHIIKPEPQNTATPFMVANEHFCMSLAAAMGLSVAPVHIRRVPEPVLVVERFDRKWEKEADVLKAGRVERIHTIDGCQAVGAVSWRKYEFPAGHPEGLPAQRTGVGFKSLFDLEPHFENAYVARLFIVRWALFNLLIGNSDAHAKNISFFQTERGLTPAPMYDLVSTRVYGRAILQDLSMGYGDAFQAEGIDADAMYGFSKDAGISMTMLAAQMTELAVAAKTHVTRLTESKVYTNGERELVLLIAERVRRQVDWMLKTAFLLK